MLTKRKAVTVVMDNDKAGENGVKIRAKTLAKHGCKVLVAKWPLDRPEHHDITDELKIYGLESFRAILASARPMSDGGSSLICLADVESENVEWLWYPYLPIGKLSMIEGDPGLGKSWITLAIACHVSVGKGLPGVLPGEPQNVLLMSCEDGLGDTIKPRLTSMEADASKVFAPAEIFTFDDNGIKILEMHLAQIKPKLIVIDPLVAYMGGKIDMNRANETRQLMAKLADLAARSSCVILMLRHLTKASSDKAIYRGIGSIDLTSACRSVILVGASPDNRAQRALVHTKCNLAEMGPAQGYTIENAKFAWTGESTLTATDILGTEQSSNTRTSALDEAKTFLERVLSRGERPQMDVDDEAEGEGISRITLNRAKKELGVIARRQGIKGERGSGQWFWRLPDQSQDGVRLDDQLHLDDQKVHADKLITLIDEQQNDPFGDI